MPIHDVVYYTDLKVVLGYIQNESRRFYVYVVNRVQLIRSVSDPSQWRYIDSCMNPADLATRGSSVKRMKESLWLTGPEFLKRPNALDPSSTEMSVIDPADPEIRITTHRAVVRPVTGIGSERFVCFSKFAILRRALAKLIAKVKEFKERRRQAAERRHNGPSRRKLPSVYPTVEDLRNAELLMIRTVQRECFTREIEILETLKVAVNTDDRKRARQKKNVLKGSTLHRLDPFADEQGILRVGGRLHRSSISFPEKHPILLPKRHHLSRLVIHHFHEKVYHQGRRITSGAVRTAGFWTVGEHGLVSKVINLCVTCQRLRSPSLTQHMSALPAERAETHHPSRMWDAMSLAPGTFKSERPEVVAPSRRDGDWFLHV